MKYIFSITLAFTIGLTVHSQNVIISDDGTTVPDASAMLELKSDSLAFLIPRMTGAEMEAIASPVEGLMVFNTSSDLVCIYNGSEWLTSNGDPTSIEVGDLYQGGVVYEVDGTGLHGKIAAVADIDGGSGVAWGCLGSSQGTTSTTDGSANTASIVAGCATVGIAAELCDSYSVLDGGVTYDDWYLPAEDEMIDLYAQRATVGGFNEGNVYYWTSTESDANYARCIYFNSAGAPWNGTAFQRFKTDNYLVRPIRTF